MSLEETRRDRHELEHVQNRALSFNITVARAMQRRNAGRVRTPFLSPPDFKVSTAPLRTRITP
jgi:hypothetical protein